MTVKESFDEIVKKCPGAHVRVSWTFDSHNVKNPGEKEGYYTIAINDSWKHTPHGAVGLEALTAKALASLPSPEALRLAAQAKIDAARAELEKLEKEIAEMKG